MRSRWWRKARRRKAIKLDTLEPWYMTPEQTQARVRADYEKQGRLFRIIGTKLE